MIDTHEWRAQQAQQLAAQIKHGDITRLVKETGVSRRSIHEILANDRNYSVDALIKLRSALDLPVEFKEE